MIEFDEEIFNPKRFAIMTVLFLFRRVTEGDLAKTTGIQWGSLSTHLSRLEKRGYVIRRKSITKEGIRTVVEITEEGYKKYSKEIGKLERIVTLIQSKRLSGINEISHTS